MMRIGLITDTHIPLAAKEIPPKVAEIFQGVDLILHAGDIYELPVLDELGRIAPVLAALGDDDAWDMLQDERVEMKHTLNLQGQTLWLVHERPYVSFLTLHQKEEAPDIVVYGHTHTAQVQRSNGVLFVGSGSPTFLNYIRGPGTVGILDIDANEAQASIVRL